MFFVNSNKSSTKCEECERECEQPRPKGCVHECSIGSCHIGPCKECKQLTKMKCHCKSNFVYVECKERKYCDSIYLGPFGNSLSFLSKKGHKWNGATEKEQNQFKSCRVPCSNTVKIKFYFISKLEVFF